MSKTVITAVGDDLTCQFDKRFGRAHAFCVIDETSGETVFYKNEHADANHGAGTKAAEKMVELNVKKIISGDFGPKAKELLEKFNIQMVIIQDDSITIQEMVTKLVK